MVKYTGYHGNLCRFLGQAHLKGRIGMLSELTVGRISVGIRQSEKAIECGAATKLFVADDACEEMIRPLIERAVQAGIPVERAATMEALGKACGIAVGASAAVLL